MGCGSRSYGNLHCPKLSQEGCDAITKLVLKEEVGSLIMSMNSYKAPSLDGFQSFFFKEYWDIVGDNV